MIVLRSSGVPICHRSSHLMSHRMSHHTSLRSSSTLSVARRGAVAVCALALVTACASGPSGAPPAAAPAPKTATPTPAAAPASWGFAHAPGRVVYDVRSESTVERSGDGATEREPVTSTARVRFDLAPGGAGDALTIDGAVESYNVSAGGRVAAPVSQLSSAIPFRGSWRTRGTAPARLEPTPGSAGAGAAADSCDSPAAAALSVARELLVSVPPSLAPGTRWQDSTAVLVCRSGVPIATRTLYQYEVRGRESFGGGDAIHVRRRSTGTLVGQPTPRARVASLNGTTEGTAELYFDPAGGRYLGGTADSKTQLVLRVGRADAEQKLVQQTRQTVGVVTR